MRAAWPMVVHSTVGLTTPEYGIQVPGLPLPTAYLLLSDRPLKIRTGKITRNVGLTIYHTIRNEFVGVRGDADYVIIWKFLKQLIKYLTKRFRKCILVSRLILR
jgi:hypothetical protein